MAEQKEPASPPRAAASYERTDSETRRAELTTKVPGIEGMAGMLHSGGAEKSSHEPMLSPTVAAAEAAQAEKAERTTFQSFKFLFSKQREGESRDKSLVGKMREECCDMSIKGPNVRDSASYQASDLSRWSALCLVKGTVWRRYRLWTSMGCCLLVAFSVLIIALVSVDDPASLQSDRFAALSTFMNVFVGLLLGFFMASSIGRWYLCANGFLEFFDAVRNLQMQFHALGVSHDSETLCMRYAILSAWLLRIELYVTMKPLQERNAEFDKHWNDLLRIRPGLVLENEESFLHGMAHDGLGEPSLLVWTWVASKVGRMAMDGEIPAMQTPTYGRIINICEMAHNGIRAVRGSIAVQAPFVYVHMLSSLVHMNNVINGLSFGLTSGTMVGTLIQRYRMGKSAAGYDEGASHQDVYNDVQNFIVTFVFSVFGPFIYHALLEVCICIAQPFDNEEGALPTFSMTKNLERDIIDAKVFSETLFRWKKPCFKKKA